MRALPLSTVVADMSNTQWRPLVYTVVAIVLYIAVGVLGWRLMRSARRVRLRSQYWRYAVRARITRKRTLREAAADVDRWGVDNPSTVPPPAERLLWPALWMVEVFLPTHAERLARSIHAVGWDETNGLGDSDALAWLREARARGGPSSTWPGVFRSNAPLPAGTVALSRKMDIPEVFSSLRPIFIQLGPGVTVLIARFMLAEKERACLENTLRRPASAEAVATSWTGYSVTPRSMVRLRRLGDERERIRSVAADWLASNFRGIFSEQQARPPTWDLITSEHEPLSPEALAHDDWRQGLGLGFGSDRWTFDPSNDALVLVNPGFREESQPKPTFTALRSVLLDAVAGTHPSLEGVSYMLEERAAPLMALWGTVDAVREYELGLSALRDEHRGRRKRYRGTRRYLRQVRDDVLPAARDLATIASLAGFLDGLESERWFAFHSGDMALLGDADGTRLRGWLRERLSERAERARRHADEVTNATRSYSDLLVASSNLRLQRTVAMLTFVLTVLTIAGVWISIEALNAK